MQYASRWGFLSMAILIAANGAVAGDFSGSYVAAGEPGLTLVLKEPAGNAITGTLTQDGVSQPLGARIKGVGFAGTIGSGDEAMPFTATVQGEQLILEIGPTGESERLTFKRASVAHGKTPPPAAAAASGKRNVVINEQRLSDADLLQAERTYKIRIPDANYWYDPVLGAWGAKGGPTMGFILPGLKLGGALHANASGGGTNVFVNGRELHAYDLAALQQITGPIVPGRYFITAQGLAGPEGGPPMWNLAAMAAQSQGGGGSNTWQGRVTGASGFSDGTTGAVFLPNGGIVSTGN